MRRFHKLFFFCMLDTYFFKINSFKIFYYCSSAIVSIFSPPLCPSHPPLPPTLHPTTFGFVHMSIVHVPHDPSPFLLNYSSHPSPVFTVSLFFISMSLVIFYLLCFVHQVPLIGEIMWYLSFTIWLISRSIMLMTFSLTDRAKIIFQRTIFTIMSILSSLFQECQTC